MTGANSQLQAHAGPALRVRERTSWITRASCAIWGHHVDNHVFTAAGKTPRRTCRCGAEYLGSDASTRVRHTLSCFLGHHTYQRLMERDGHHEYVCVQCGHPLLFAADSDPYAQAAEFNKKVRYLCGIFGHRVSQVTTRDGFAEYACGCGHTFLRPESKVALVRHPARCVVAGHWITFLTTRAGYAEYLCLHCGHPFCFAAPEKSPPLTSVS
jgi:DNA-directed RNA polymerase subunit RPC12/RpoP